MTAISTIFSVAMLPFNLLIYTTLAYEGADEDVVQGIDWVALFVSLTIVILAISSGLFCSARVRSPVFNIYANRLGNLAGISLIVFSTILSTGRRSSGGEETMGVVQLWTQRPLFYIGVATPCLIGLILANLATTFLLKLPSPERV